MIPGQPPQEVLSYYVHGNPFIHRDGHPSEYTLGDMRTAYATRLAVSNQYQVCLSRAACVCRKLADTSQRHKPENRHNHPQHTPNTYSHVPNQAQAPIVFQSQAAPHSFRSGYYPGHHIPHSFHDQNHFLPVCLAQYREVRDGTDKPHPATRYTDVLSYSAIYRSGAHASDPRVDGGSTICGNQPRPTRAIQLSARRSRLDGSRCAYALCEHPDMAASARQPRGGLRRIPRAYVHAA